MNVVFFNFATLNYAGGAEQVYMGLGKWFKGLGYKVSFISASKNFCDVLVFVLRQGTHVQNVSDDDLHQNFSVDKYLKFDLVDLLPTKKFKEISFLLRNADFILSKNEIIEVLLLKFFFRVDMSKVVFSFHTSLIYPVVDNFKQRLHNMLYGSSLYFWIIKESRVHLLSNSVDLDMFVKNNFEMKKLKVIPNPVDINKFSMRSLGKKKSFNIYYIGRMTEQKGVDIYSKTIERLSNYSNFNRMSFFFVGSGDRSFLFKELSERFGNCHFLGFKNDVVSCYKDADLVVLASKAETFSYSVAEAQSCGVPVVASDISGPNGIVLDRRTGWLCRVNDEEDLLSKIVEAFDLWDTQYSEYIRFSESSRKNLVDNFSEEVVNSSLLEFIKKQ